MGFPKAHTMGLAVLAAAGWAGAHLSSNTLSVKGGETFTPGQSVTLTWNVSVVHGDGTQIDLSGDGGATWTSVKAGIKEVSGTNSFKMNMPEQPSARVKLRVCQGSASACASIKASQPSTPPYTLVSGEFAISGSSALRPMAAEAQAVVFDSRSGTLSASFTLERDGEVRIQAFDPRGRLLATLLDGRYEAGSHRLRIAAPRGLASGQALLFRLQSGESVRTQTWVRY